MENQQKIKGSMNRYEYSGEYNNKQFQLVWRQVEVGKFWFDSFRLEEIPRDLFLSHNMIA
jgi:hypothetical protein